jgi:hypothetical protein
MMTIRAGVDFVDDEPIIRKVLGPNFRPVTVELTETRTYADSTHRFYAVTALSETYRNELTICVAYAPGSPRIACRLGSNYHLRAH